MRKLFRPRCTTDYWWGLNNEYQISSLFPKCYWQAKIKKPVVVLSKHYTKRCYCGWCQCQAQMSVVARVHLVIFNIYSKLTKIEFHKNLEFANPITSRDILASDFEFHDSEEVSSSWYTNKKVEAFSWNSMQQ